MRTSSTTSSSRSIVMESFTTPAPAISDKSYTILDVITDGWYDGFTKTYARRIQKVIIWSTHAGKPSAWSTSTALPPWSHISVVASGSIQILCGFIDDNGNFQNRRIKHLMSGSTLQVTWEASTSSTSTKDNCRVLQMTMVL